MYLTQLAKAAIQNKAPYLLSHCYSAFSMLYSFTDPLQPSKVSRQIIYRNTANAGFQFPTGRDAVSGTPRPNQTPQPHIQESNPPQSNL
jgi:hypothetical protein